MLELQEMEDEGGDPTFIGKDISHFFFGNAKPTVKFAPYFERISIPRAA